MKFYVYCFSDRKTRVPLYIGKGSGSRDKQHLQPSTYRRACPPWYDEVRRLMRAGTPPVCRRLLVGLSEEEALKMEKFFILAIGRRVTGDGPLFNVFSSSWSKRELRDYCRERGLRLLEQIRNGGEAAGQLLIEKTQPFVRCIAEHYAKRPGCARWLDEFIDAGMYGLVKSINQVRNGKMVREPGAYFSYWIRREILLVIAHEQKHRAVGLQEWTRSPESVTDLRDAIYSCCETDEERQLLELREFHGLECPEIGEILGVSRRTAYRMLERIEQRFNEKMHHEN